MHKIQCYIKADTILHINSKPPLYFMIKDAIKLNKFIADLQTAKRKNNSNIKNYYSQII